jgi:hypothetical protein
MSKAVLRAWCDIKLGGRRVTPFGVEKFHPI